MKDTLALEKYSIKTDNEIALLKKKIIEMEEEISVLKDASFKASDNMTIGEKILQEIKKPKLFTIITTLLLIIIGYLQIYPRTFPNFGIRRIVYIVQSAWEEAHYYAFGRFYSPSILYNLMIYGGFPIVLICLWKLFYYEKLENKFKSLQGSFFIKVIPFAIYLISIVILFRIFGFLSSSPQSSRPNLFE